MLDIREIYKEMVEKGVTPTLVSEKLASVQPMGDEFKNLYLELKKLPDGHSVVLTSSKAGVE